MPFLGATRQQHGRLSGGPSSQPRSQSHPTGACKKAPFFRLLREYVLREYVLKKATLGKMIGNMSFFKALLGKMIGNMFLKNRFFTGNMIGNMSFV